MQVLALAPYPSRLVVNYPRHGRFVHFLQKGVGKVSFLNKAMSVLACYPQTRHQVVLLQVKVVEGAIFQLLEGLEHFLMLALTLRQFLPARYAGGLPADAFSPASEPSESGPWRPTVPPEPRAVPVAWGLWLPGSPGTKPRPQPGFPSAFAGLPLLGAVGHRHLFLPIAHIQVLAGAHVTKDPLLTFPVSHVDGVGELNGHILPSQIVQDRDQAPRQPGPAVYHQGSRPSEGKALLPVLQEGVDMSDLVGQVPALGIPEVRHK